MLNFYAEKFVELNRKVFGNYHIERILTEEYLQIIPQNEKKSGDSIFGKDSLTTDFAEIEELCKELGLDGSLALVKVIQDRLKIPVYGSKAFSLDVIAFMKTLEDDFSSRFCVILSRDEAALYTKNNLFGEEVFNCFPDANFDIEEAGKCLAFGRNTACVMHLMRVMEAGRNALSKMANIALTNPNWQDIINQINSKINAPRASKTKKWVEQEPFLSEVTGNLFAVKVAWRNSSMHLDKTYDEETAKDIYNAVRGFMRHLAKHLDEKGKFRKASKK